MSIELKKLTRHTAIYTFGNLIYRAASFVLVPLYARVLAPADYGKLELITVITFIIQSLLSAGISHAVLRFYYEYECPADRRRLVSSAFLSSLALSIVGAALLVWFAPHLSSLMFGSPAFTAGFRLAAVTMAFEISREMSLALVRAMERAGFFIVVSITQLCVQVGVTVYTVVFLKMGILGVLTGNFVASSSIWVILTWFTIRQCGVAFQWRMLPPIGRYAGPLMLSSFSYSAFQYLDRFTLNSAASLNAVGIYALSVRIVNVVPVLVLLPFTNSYGPFRFSIMKQANARQIYARVLSYYVMAVGLIGLGIAAFSREILILFASPEYREAYRIVPLLLVPQALGGVQYCLQTGIYIEKRTKYLFYIASSTSALNIALVFTLIPRFGVMGAAWAAILAAVYGVSASFVLSQRVYPIQYEYGRLLKTAGAALTVGWIGFQFRTDDLVYALTAKAALVASYPILLGVLRCYTEQELQFVRELWFKVCGRLQLKHAV